MKQISIVMALLLAMQFAGAQKIVEKHIDYSGKKMISLKLEIADSIRIIAWNKNQVYTKASININNNQNNDAYEVNFDDEGTTVRVHSRFRYHNSCCGDSSDCCNCNCHDKIYFDVYVPENADFSVETINGDITITGKTGEIRAHSISGFIDLTLQPDTKADLRMNTITGTMYSNFDFSSEKNLRHVGGSSVSTMLNGGGENAIELETISGDIFLRKRS
ncbi:MAG TPA: hypothetical protein VKR32_19460 [Puia sp.]|nr:hypothetical protein [Puia sp.]